MRILQCYYSRKEKGISIEQILNIFLISTKKFIKSLVLSYTCIVLKQFLFGFV